MQALRIIVAFLLGSFMVGITLAQSVPTVLNYQGQLTSNSPAQDPISGNLQMEFGIYGSAGGADILWSESWPVVDVNEGIFSVLLGSSGTPIPPSVFDGTTRYLEVIVNGETMDPRTPIGSVAYADEAERLGGLMAADIQELTISTGAIEFFDLTECPPGWSEYTEASGRLLVGLQSGGMQGGSVGSPLGNLEDRTHAHSAGPFGLTTSTIEDHTHTVDANNVWTAYGGNHNHYIDPPPRPTSVLTHNHTVGTSSGQLLSAGSHNHFEDPLSGSTFTAGDRHRWAYKNTNNEWWTWASNGTTLVSIVNWGDGVGNEGSGEFPLSTSNTGLVTGHTSEGSHSHSLDLPGTTLDTASHPHTVSFGGFTLINSTHGHTVDIPETMSTHAAHQHDVWIQTTMSTVGGSHDHVATIGSAVSSDASTSDTIPYIQLLACRKD